jgi:putative transposase
MGVAFCATVARLGMHQSANANGQGDNAHAESFFHSLKAELTRGVIFSHERVLRTALTAYMRYYNTIRLHSGLSYLSPLAFERRVA